MKKFLVTIIAALLLIPYVQSQQVLTIYPDKDAALVHGESAPYNSNQSNPHGTSEYLTTYKWTWSGIPITIKALIGIDLSQLPESAYILDAKLYLYSTATHANNNINGSGYNPNTSLLSRVVTSWNEDEVTWNTNLILDTDNETTLDNSEYIDEDYIVIVTDLIKDIQANPTTSDGLMLSLVNEIKYTKMQFASSDHSNSALHPKLEITYTSNFSDQAGFEFTKTKWGNIDEDDLDWNKEDGSTPSVNTGPNTASEGTTYLFVEASGTNNPSKTAILHSPLYSFMNLNNPFIGFDYHMYGSSMGSLHLEVSKDYGVTWEPAVWSKSGDQGNEWHSANVDLSDYEDENVILRFHGVTGSGYTSDMALDNITVYATNVTEPSKSENYIHNIFPKSENGVEGQTIQEIQYFDGLGRINQGVTVASSPAGYDVIKPYEYDDYGRMPRDYQSYPTTVNEYGVFRDNATSNSEDYFATLYGTAANEAYSYSTTVFEESPLNRVLKQGGPGEAFSPSDETNNATEHVQHFEYQSNIASEVRYFSIDQASGALLNGPSHYAEDELFKIRVEDENGNITEEFKDKLGRVILKRAFNGPDTYSTYYVYDDFGLLRWVLPPKAEADNGIPTTDILNQVCYYYTYDSKKRLVEKKLPNVEPVYMVYDDRDRLVCIQDGVMRGNDEWQYTKYDVLNRPAKTGIIKMTTSFTWILMQLEVDNFYDIQTNPMYEERISTGNGYSNLSYPSSALNIQSDQALSYTYYDDYSHHSLTDFPDQSPNIVDNIDNYIDPQGSNLTYFDRVKGQVTGSAILVLNGDGDKWIYSTTYYDDRYRVIQQKSTLFPEGTTMISNRFDFNNNLLESLEIQKVDGQNHKIRYLHKYDHANRPIDTYIYLNDNEPVLLSSLKYNELGQLREKNLHLDDQNGFAQSMDYLYNMRGWLTDINDPQNLNPDGDKFALNLYYDDPVPDQANDTYFNGNISGIIWRSTHSTPSYAYEFTYDDLNRIISSNYKTRGYMDAWSDPTSYETTYKYDLNGNIDELTRNNELGTTIDDLEYTYIGNQIDYVTDGATSDGFMSKNSGIKAYVYDDNGNMTWDKNKELKIDYNLLNLPEKVYEDGGAGDNILYIYDASGVKWSKEVNLNDSWKNTMYAGNFIYEDTSNNSTENYIIDYVLNPEGLIDFEGSTIEYYYHLKDHLGNTRMVIDETGSIKQEAEYYPFGMLFSDNQGGDNKYLYNGKEIQDEQLGGVNLDWYDYGARFYDPALGRWHAQDPASEEYLNQSPYQYVLNNPIILIDPDGQRVKFSFKEQTIKLGAGYGGYISRQWGTAKDNYGYSWYQIGSKNIASPPSGKMVFGAEIDIYDRGIGWSRENNSFKDFVDNQEQIGTLSASIFDFSFTDEGYIAFSAGASYGWAYSIIPSDEVISYSFSTKEKSHIVALAGGSSFIDVEYLSITMQTTLSADGEIVVNNSSGELVIQLPGEKAIGTGIMMMRVSDQEMWESISYNKSRTNEE